MWKTLSGWVKTEPYVFYFSTHIFMLICKLDILDEQQ